MSTRPHDPVFQDNNHFSDGSEMPRTGLTKREYFAAMAMQGLLAGDGVNGSFWDTYENMIGRAVKCSDDLIDALNARKE